MNILDEAKKVFAIESRAVARLAERLDDNFEKAVRLIHDCGGRVIVCGMGKSGLIGKKIAATLASTGTPAFYLHPAEASHGDLGMVTGDDVVLALSNSGETDELLALLPHLKRFNVKLLALTGNTASTLARASDVRLDVSVEEEACPMGIVPTASTTAALAMGDALAVALLLMRGLKEEDFAAFHPRGSLGKKLLVTVGELMHAGEEVPRVSPDSPMTQTVMEISSKRLGITTVVDSDGKLLGVVTDGDLRRGIEEHGSALFSKTAETIMTRSPKSIAAGELAAKALAVMEKHSITSLPVPDAQGRPAGIIHLHDILREGIA
ncbi:MAG: KpsF/GutQ family sugar-phosphate isomerase [Nitrospirota bacterium]|jgi:arabinose-5-phosphate isomerase